LIEQSENAIEALFRIMKTNIVQIEQLNPLFFHDFKKYHPRIYKQVAQPGDIRDYSITLNLLETGVKQKVFRSDINIDIVNRTLHELFELFGLESSFIQAGYRHKQMFDHIIIPYLRGISTEKGLALLANCKKILD
jgi:hypothetical protein